MRTLSLRRLALVALTLTTGACASEPQTVVHTTTGPGYYKVVDNQVLDKSGKAHYFHGVARPSLEQQPAGIGISAADFRAMAAWKANVVRLSLNQEFWLFGAGAAAYQGIVLQAVEWAKAAGLDVILDLHWSDKGVQGAAGQQKMADRNSLDFWKSVASFYKDDERVLFELYNEPHNISWDVWLHGGSAGDFDAVGMQQLYDAVRATGANNLVIAGGLDYAFDLSGVATHLIQGVNIMYATHPYDSNNWKPVESFDAKWGYLTATHPVIVSEFGAYDCSTGYTSAVIDYADRTGSHWTGWAWYVGGCGYPSLIEDWDGTPSPPGVVVKAALARYAAQGMPVTEDGGIAQPKLDGNVPDLPLTLDLPLADDAPAALDRSPALDTSASEAGAID